MLKGAFIGFGNVAANGHMPGWRSRDEVRIVAATDAAASRGEAFLAACSGGRPETDHFVATSSRTLPPSSA